MTDRELLELAAKAAGLEVTGFYGEFWLTVEPRGENVGWNPLTDDGDALRLAVALGLRLTLPKYKGFGSSAESQHGGVAGCTAFREDPMEQTREAIVRAAAEIGKAML